MPIKSINTICPFCGVGCGMGLRVSNQQVIGVEPLSQHPISHGQLCSKGWSTAFGIDPRDRITTPLIKDDGRFRVASWDEALSLIASKFKQFIAESGNDAVGVTSSARATNEDNYATQKFARAVLKTNNVDHCARICHSPSVAGLKKTLGSGAMSNSADDIEKADVIVVAGADSTENHAILGGRIMRAKFNGTKLIVIDPRETRLAQLADLHLQLKLGTNVALFNGLVNIIFKNGWENTAFLDERCEGLDALREYVKDYPITKVSEITGVTGIQLIEAARIYSHARAAFLAYGMGITQYVSGTRNVIAVSNLVLVCGQIGRPGCGINPLRGQNNVQGACDMGCLPNVYPDYQDVLNKDVQHKFSKAWKTEVPTTPGLTSLGMSRMARQGHFRGLIIFGEDPVVTDPDQNMVASGFKAMDLLVVVELTLTETAKYADLILPAASFAEKNGTFTNCERRVQCIHKAVAPPGQALADWQILSKLAEHMGCGSLMNWPDAEAVFMEMAALTNSFSGMSYAVIEQQHGLQWPCNREHPAGTPYLHKNRFPIGKAKLMPVQHTDPVEMPDEEYPFYLTTNRLHFHYGCGSMTRKSPLLERETPDGILFINPHDAHKLKLIDHSPVAAWSRRGYIETRAVLSEHMPRGVVTMPYHFKEAPSNQLTNDAFDPITKMPELKACAVAIKALPTGQQPRTINEIKQASAIKGNADVEVHHASL